MVQPPLESLKILAFSVPKLDSAEPPEPKDYY